MHMATGFSIHIGLNHISEEVYGSGNDLAGCINDAHDMQRLAVAQGFQSSVLLDDAATAEAVIAAISGAASCLVSGDTLFLTYSGHGSHVPDRNDDEADGQDETWCLYDRMLLDDELNALWAQFAAGVRVLMLSDSCHSGTVARRLAARQLRRQARFRGLTESESAQVYLKSKAFYDTTQRLFGAKTKDLISCTVILISGCQDNQLSADGDVNGLFTEKVKQIWDDAAFRGNYRAFHKAIAAFMPSDQSPQFSTYGASNIQFENERPFTVESSEATEPQPASLSVTGPSHLHAAAAAPSFQVNPGPNKYYIFEITSDASLFDTLSASSRRNVSNFYGSWSDTAHHIEAEYQLAQAVWNRLKSAATLYYRIGSTATSSGWTNYMVSTGDSQYSSAPSITIEHEATGTDEVPSTGPSVRGPASLSASDAAPSFDVDTAGAPYFIVEIAGEARLLDGPVSDAERTEGLFYATWQDSGLKTGASYTLPDAVWERLSRNDRLYYRIGTTTSASGWENYTVSTADSDAESAPSIEISPRALHVAKRSSAAAARGRRPPLTAPSAKAG
jgi:hypothetical protein